MPSNAPGTQSDSDATRERENEVLSAAMRDKLG
jgi:hypothetical protein